MLLLILSYEKDSVTLMNTFPEKSFLIESCEVMLLLCTALWYTYLVHEDREPVLHIVGTLLCVRLKNEPFHYLGFV